MKRIIADILITICFVSTGWYAYSIYQDYLQKKTEWDKEARETFREAVDMEVKKISQIPIRIIPINIPEVSTLEDPTSESVKLGSIYGMKEYQTPQNKILNSYTTDRKKNAILSTLLKDHPIDIDSLNLHWDSLLISRNHELRTRTRYTTTDVLEHTDTIHSKQRFAADSLISIYLGYRYEVELTGYIAYPRWWETLTAQQVSLLVLLWIVCIVFITFYDLIKKRLRPQPIIIEKERTKYIEVEKIVQATNNPKDKITDYELPDGTRFDSIRGELHGINNNIASLSPQETLMLAAFVKAESYQVSMDEAMDIIWGSLGNPTKFHRLLQRLRNTLKGATSVTIKNIGKGIYQLIGSKDIEEAEEIHSNM